MRTVKATNGIKQKVKTLKIEAKDKRIEEVNTAKLAIKRLRNAKVLYISTERKNLREIENKIVGFNRNSINNTI